MSINIQHTFEYPFGDNAHLPAIRIVRQGKAASRDGVIYTPHMDTYAEVQIAHRGGMSSLIPKVRLNVHNLRALADYLTAAADWMDAGLRPEVEYRVEDPAADDDDEEDEEDEEDEDSVRMMCSVKACSVKAWGGYPGVPCPGCGTIGTVHPIQ